MQLSAALLSHTPMHLVLLCCTLHARDFTGRDVTKGRAVIFPRMRERQEKGRQQALQPYRVTSGSCCVTHWHLFVSYHDHESIVDESRKVAEKKLRMVVRCSWFVVVDAAGVCTGTTYTRVVQQLLYYRQCCCICSVTWYDMIVLLVPSTCLSCL